MKAIAKWAARKIAARLDAFDLGGEALIRVGTDVYVRLPIEAAAAMKVMPKVNPFLDEHAMAYRQESAMTLLDDDVFGFVLLVFRPDKPEIDLRMQTEPEWMPLFGMAAAKVVQAV